MNRVVPVLGVLALLGCDQPRPPPQKAATAMPSSPPVPSPSQAAAPGAAVSIAFCAYGGSGVLPRDANADDFYRVLAFVVIQSPVDVTGASVRALEILGDAGIEASMKRIESIERLEPAAQLTPPGVWQARGKAFDGRLATGATRLRVEAWITRPPRSRPSTLRIELGSDAVRATSTCKLEIEWPTG